MEQKANSIAPNYHMNKEDYESLDQIIETFINPINAIMENIPENNKFLRLSEE